MYMSSANPGSDGNEYQVQTFHEITDPPISLEVAVLEGGLYDEDQPLTLRIRLKNRQDEEVRFTERRQAQFMYVPDIVPDAQYILWPLERVEGKEDELFTFTDCWARIRRLGQTLDLQSETIDAQETLESRLYLLSAGSDPNGDKQLEPTCPDEVPTEIEFESSVNVRYGDRSEPYRWGFRLTMPIR